MYNGSLKQQPIYKNEARILRTIEVPYLQFMQKITKND